MAQLTFGPKFFQNEVKNYVNWTSAFWRELFQNSIDAGATRIELTTTPTSDGPVRVEFLDNGCGMSREVIENVYLSVGETTKDSPNSIGGFGKARILTCYAQRNYVIYSGYTAVEGKGIEYTLSSQSHFTPGTQLTITVEPQDFGSNADMFCKSLQAYLSYCQLSCAVYVNGVKFTNWLNRNKLTRELSIGSVYTNKTGADRRAYQCIMRVNGVAMFQRSTSTPVQVVLELTPQQSRSYLVSNRDSLTWTASNALDQFLNELSADTASALRDPMVATKDVVGGDATLYIPRNKRQAIVSRLNSASPLPGNKQIAVKLDAKSSAVAFDHQASVNVAQSAPAILGDGWHQTGSRTITTDPIFEGMIIQFRSVDKRIKKAAKLYAPDVAGPRRRKLLQQWAIAIEAAIDAMAECVDLDSMVYRLGWCFWDDAEALYEQQQDGSHAILLNPVYAPSQAGKGEPGTIRFGLRDFASHVHLLTLACHEVCHVQHCLHNEEFACLLTDVVAKAFTRITETHLKMDAAAN